MRTNLNILEEYLKLGYNECLRPDKLRDRELDKFTIIRSSYQGDVIHYLSTGSSLTIPWEWIDLFRGLVYYEGSYIINNITVGYYDTFIKLFTDLQTYPINYTIDGKQYLNTLSEICSLGTKKFRDYLKKEFELNFEPLEFRSLLKNYSI